MDLSKVKDRDGLKAKREPYWQRLRPGAFVGYRVSRKGEGAGSWIARVRSEDDKAYRLRALGSFGELPPSERFAAAKKAAETFADLIDSGGQARPEISTVADACREFGKTRPDAEARFRRYLYPDPIAGMKLEKLRRRHVIEWRERLLATPVQVSRNKVGPKRTKPRTLGSLNRDMAPFRAALAMVLPVGAPNTEAAWQEPLKPTKGSASKRRLYLTRSQIRAMLSKLDPEAEPFIRTLSLLPVRPGALASATVGDFDGRTGRLTVVSDKAGAGRTIPVGLAAAILIQQARDKLPGAYLFTRANGQRWTKETWNDHLAEAATAAELPSGVTCYSLRHSAVTDMISEGQADLFTVAKVAGTSVAMIERHYAHLRQDVAERALAALAL